MKSSKIDNKRKNEAIRNGFQHGIKKSKNTTIIAPKYEIYFYLGYNKGLTYNKNRKIEILKNDYQGSIEKNKRNGAKEIGFCDGKNGTCNINKVKNKYLYYYQDGLLEGIKYNNNNKEKRSLFNL